MTEPDAVRNIPSLDLIDRVVAADIGAIARMITRAEAGKNECRPALAEIYKRTGRAHIVGITGVPGSGKSTLMGKLIAMIRETGRKVAVVAIDPSSPFSGGAILGDRIRMNELAGDKGIFIRSMATRGSLGGLARASLDAVDVLDAAGFDMILIETVGVGQDEVDIVQAAHTTIVVSAPGLGDDIQAIKAGILEIADIHVVSKCDRPDANRTITDLKGMMTLGLSLSGATNWPVPVIATSALKLEGVSELLKAIDQHWEYLGTSGELDKQKKRIAERRMLKTAEEILRDKFQEHRDGKVSTLIEQMMAHETNPYAAAQDLLAEIRMEK
ncbi:MAG: methylmalonyl Co-A mutase-associated GTPase MeaB [Rhodospirillaceae bacterium]|nr:MAG: methylmalonyl Co-A mutase-associated GTPase MeaB [Rhodospirillaceae bacterium]